MSAPQQPSAFAGSDEDNASIDTSDLKSGDIDSLDKSNDLPSDDDTENDDEDDEAIPVASIVASGSLSDDDAVGGENNVKGEKGNGIFLDTTGQSSSAKATADDSKITADANNQSTPAGGKRKAPAESSSVKKRKPAAKGLFVPFRTVKKIMQQDPDTNIIQNDAAIMVTAATGLFLKEFTEKSLENCKKKGRNTIKYDDVAEVRANNKNYSFLDMLLP